MSVGNRKAGDEPLGLDLRLGPGVVFIEKEPDPAADVPVVVRGNDDEEMEA